ncbi:MAG: bifunctional 4-hydroxy-2-oxoglutarate aldolase/2-dehydro-3-deoxy-phosphogluconate aldolase [Blastocatellia bacterium]
MEIANQVRRIGIIPVVSLPKVEQALPLAESLLAGGLPCAEITFRTAAAAAGIERISLRFPELFLGAGTILSIDHAQRALDVGARFIVSPGTNPAVVDFCVAKGAVIFPGVCTPTEIEMNLAKGLDVLKFFPAELAGGVPFLKAIGAPYRDVRFIPTGGIDTKNIDRYLALPNVLACGGSWMVKPELFETGDFAAVTRLAAEAVALVKQLRAE